MKLLTAELRKQLPALYSQENEKDPMVICKFFSPYLNWTWYATEFDGKDTFFGYVMGEDNELGYFSLSELESLTRMNGKLPLVETDKFFKPCKLSEVKND